MTLEQARSGLRGHDEPGVHMPRLRLKPKLSRGGYVDGAWWPRSDDLNTELPDLIAVLSFRLGTIDHVTYNFTEWRRASAELATDGRAVQLDGYRRQPPNTLEIVDVNDKRMVLLVVPSQTEPDNAHAIVMAAAAPNNVSSVDTLLEISEQDRESRTKATAAHERWNSPGGGRPTHRGRHRATIPGRMLQR
ncbi:MAG: DUF5994 family protein [Mycobacterium sp.]